MFKTANDFEKAVCCVLNSVLDGAIKNHIPVHRNIATSQDKKEFTLPKYANNETDYIDILEFIIQNHHTKDIINEAPQITAASGRFCLGYNPRLSYNGLLFLRNHETNEN
jgi:hypothetical protein